MRGFTLIELMVTVAALGIATVTIGNAALQQRKDGVAVLHRERAEQLLGYQAQCVASGQPPVAATMRRLTDGLPGATVERSPEGATTRVTVKWAGHSRSLVVFAKAVR